jgi:hypothetical protein
MEPNSAFGGVRLEVRRHVIDCECHCHTSSSRVRPDIIAQFAVSVAAI